MRVIPGIFVLLLSTHLFAQEDAGLSMEGMVKGKSALILDESLEINIYGKERGSGDYTASSYRAFRIRRKYTVKILHEKGLDIFKKLVLPEDFDPTYKAHAPAVKNLGIYYSAYKIQDFSVSVKREGRKNFNPKIRKKLLHKESFNINYLYEYSQVAYTVEGLEVGDEVLVQYDVEIPFQENYSRFANYRIYHHDSIPKLKYRFTLTHHESVDIELYELNGAKAKRHVVEDHIVTRMWEYGNLPGCLLEEGSRPYEHLPHLTWVMNFYKYYVHNSNQERSIPHYAVIASLKSPDLPDILTSVEIGSKSRQYTSFSKTIDRLNKEMTSDYTVIRAIHNEINEDFAYDNDQDYYRRNDMRSERLGEYFDNHTLRDLSRYNVYYALMAMAGLNFYSAFAIDKRFGVFSSSYFQPSFDSDFLLAIYLGERNFDLILPKRHRFGWYYNEIPFYWEDCEAKLVHVNDYASYRYPIKEEVSSFQTYLSSPEANRRRNGFSVTVDLDFDTLHFNGEVALSGQYSTMCRQAYMKGYLDPSVNNDYHKLLWQVIPGSRFGESSLSHISSSYPFQALFNTSFRSGGKVTRDGDLYNVDLSEFFPLIVPKVNSALERYLPFHPDFLGSDEFSYELQFVRPMSLENAQHILVENDYASFEFRVEQQNPLSINVELSFVNRSSQLSASEIDDVIEINKAIRRANSYQLKVK